MSNRSREMLLRATRWLGAACLLLAALNYWLAYSRRLPIRTGFLANLLLLFLAAGALNVGRPVTSEPARLLENRRQWIGFLILMVVGAVMRTAAWDVFPVADGQLVEEAQLVKTSVTSLTWGQLDLFFPLADLTGEIGVWLFSVTLERIRYVFVALGILSVAAFFVAARFLLRSYFAAAFATTLFATSAMLAGSSRIAMETMSPVFTLCLALAALFRAHQRGDTASAALAGALNGLLLVEYDAYRIIPPLGAFLLLGAGQTGRQGAPRRSPPVDATLPRRAWSRIAPFLVFSSFAAAVLAPPVLQDPDGAVYRLSEGYSRHRAGLASEGADINWSERITEGADKIRLSAEKVFWHGGSDIVLPRSMGVLEFYTGLLALVAFLHCAIGARRDATKLFLSLSISLIVILSGVLVQNPARYRLLPLVPVALLSIGVFADDLLARIAAHRGAAAIVGLTALLVALSASNAYRFFADAIHDPRVQREFYNLDLLLAYEIRDVQAASPGAAVYLISDRTFLGVMSDFSVFYDYRRLHVVAPTSRPRLPAGAYILAHSPFITAARRLPGMSDCDSRQTRLGTDEILRCRVAPKPRHQ